MSPLISRISHLQRPKFRFHLLTSFSFTDFVPPNHLNAYEYVHPLVPLPQHILGIDYFKTNLFHFCARWKHSPTRRQQVIISCKSNLIKNAHLSTIYLCWRQNNQTMRKLGATRQAKGALTIFFRRWKLGQESGKTGNSWLLLHSRKFVP